MSQTAKAYQMLLDALRDYSAVASPAEIHGWMCGGLTVHKKGDTKRAIIALCDEFSMGEIEGIQVVLQALRELSRKQLDDVNMSFMLMLPGDEMPLEERAVALSHWVQGFLAGFAMQGGATDNEDFMADLVEISQLDAAALSGEEDESALLDISEYVRLGVITLYLDANDSKVQ